MLYSPYRESNSFEQKNHIKAKKTVYNTRKLHLAIYSHLHIAKIMCISVNFASYVRMMH